MISRISSLFFLLAASTTMVSAEIIIHFTGELIPAGVPGCEEVSTSSRSELIDLASTCTLEATEGYYNLQASLQTFVTIGDVLGGGERRNLRAQSNRQLDACPAFFPEFCESTNPVTQSNCCYFWGDWCTYCVSGNGGGRRAERRALAAEKVNNHRNLASMGPRELADSIDDYMVGHMDAMKAGCLSAFQEYIGSSEERTKCFGAPEKASAYLVDLE